MSRIQWGKAKNQVYALRNEIVELLRQGETLEGAYQHLSSQNKINMNARTFRRHATMFRQEALVPRQNAQTSTPAIKPPSPTKTDKTTGIPESPKPPSPRPIVDTTPSKGGFGHKGDGATPEFLQDAYGNSQPNPPHDKDEESNS